MAKDGDESNGARPSQELFLHRCFGRHRHANRIAAYGERSRCSLSEEGRSARQVTFEATYNWQYMYGHLDGLTARVLLAHSKEVPTIASARIKHDRIDTQVLAFHIRNTFEQVLAGEVDDWNLHQVYDIAHNMAKCETHVSGKGDEVDVLVHRKGATRAFGPDFEGLPEEYREIGQPVLVPGSMGTSSWILAGTASGMADTFGSSCNGAGHVMSRSQAKREVWGETLREELSEAGIAVRAGSMPGLAEEAPVAYKDVDEVVRTVSGAGIARRVARLVPVAVIKG